MSTLKMTFSLASLILLMALIATPAVYAVTFDAATDEVPGNGFAVVAAASAFEISTGTTDGVIKLPEDAVDIDEDNLPNIYDEIRRKGGALYTLIAPKSHMRDGGTSTDNATDIAKYDVVISEIMWAIDTGVPFADRGVNQFIELYNTILDADPDTDDNQPTEIGGTGTAADGWILHHAVGGGIFQGKSPGDTVTLATVSGGGATGAALEPLALADADDTAVTDKRDYIIVDQVGNIDVVGTWVVDIGQNGDTVADTKVDLISMRRTIDYTKVEKTDHNTTDAAANRTTQLEGIPDGIRKASWAASGDHYGTNLVGTPGAKPFEGITDATPTDVGYGIVINEVGNNTNDNYDWIELRNTGTADAVLENWQIGEIAGAKDSETTLVTFTNKATIPAGGVLLVVNMDPHRNSDHPIAAGTRVNDPHDETNATTSRYYVAGANFKLSNGTDNAGVKTLLVLRSHHEKKNTADNIVDLTGTNFISDAAFNTEIWPLKSIRKGTADNGHGDVFTDDIAEMFTPGHVYQRAVATKGTGEHVWNHPGYTGVGYKRNVRDTNASKGTPGFDNAPVKETSLDADGMSTLAESGSVTISEIMYQTTRRNAPQWIELYNSSNTNAVNLAGWKITLENAEDDAGVDIRKPTVTTNDLPAVIIPPNQTVLIVSRTSGVNSDEADGGEDFPSSRIVDLWQQKEKLEVTDRNYQLLSTTSFRITLWQKGADMTKDKPVDVAGNMGADPAWELPMADENFRSSIIRKYDKKKDDNGNPMGGPIARTGTLPIWSGEGSLEAATGMAGMDGDAGWILASASDLTYVVTHYGHKDDEGTPGYRGGGALPVSLSKFRPERLESGEIVIRWITESELNNAGFNILRSVKRDGQFAKVNTSLIAGQGTTSERTTYEWKDTSAKPNVVYYYQIQDVSLDGKVTTLRQTRLKGDVSPEGKLTTTWGELKALQ